MGIRAIEYRPWKGDRTNPNQRWTVIARHVFLKNVRAKAVIVLLIFGLMLAHAFPIIGAILIPHEDITDEDMVGTEGVVEPADEAGPEFENSTTLFVAPSLRINGSFNVSGMVAVYGELELYGNVSGFGYVDSSGGTEHNGNMTMDGWNSVDGELSLGNLYEIPPEMIDAVPPDAPPELLTLLEKLESGELEEHLPSMIGGNGTIRGHGVMLGFGNVTGEAGPEEEVVIDLGSEGYLTNGLIIIFTMLLAAIICADVIAADLADSSFVLYFSRPVRALDYLLGKITGLVWVLWLFCLVPAIAYVLVMMATMTGEDWGGAAKILGKTLVAGLVTSVYFLPYGLMISSITKSKAYAGIGIFMSFFVLSIVSGIFRGSNENWMLIDPFELLHSFYRILFDGSLPDGITSGEVGGAILAFTLVPMALVVYWIYRKGAGK